MKKIYLFLLTLCVLGIAETVHARSKSSLRRLKNIRIGKSKTIRGYNNITVNPKSVGEVYIIETDDDKHEITGMDDGIVILNFYDEDGNVEEKVIDIKDRRPDIQPNVSFGFGYGGGYYPYGGYYRNRYTPWGGWSSSWGRPYYNNFYW